MRRTPALTKQARRLFEEAVLSDGWRPGATIRLIAQATGLTDTQVRDAIFGESADMWRRLFTAAIEEEKTDASTER
jgi:hypothetical protein